MSSEKNGKETKATVEEEQTTGGPLRFDQMEEKQIQIIVEQLISLTIRKKGPQGAEAKAEGVEEAGTRASAGSASPSSTQEAEPGKGSGIGKRERRRYERRSRLLSNRLNLCDCFKGLCPVCFYLCPMCSAKRSGAKYCRNPGCLFRKAENQSGKPLNTFPFTYPN
ncbi:ARL14 effector protein-like [Macrotis lagotis]|uniref:ARL14 effector protein-like n=1 Tax=Macrotis lagotis TaxID=92651 RepID=UPI003D69C652